MFIYYSFLEIVIVSGVYESLFSACLGQASRLLRDIWKSQRWRTACLSSALRTSGRSWQPLYTGMLRLCSSAGHSKSQTTFKWEMLLMSLERDTLTIRILAVGFLQVALFTLWDRKIISQHLSLGCPRDGLSLLAAFFIETISLRLAVPPGFTEDC